MKKSSIVVLCVLLAFVCILGDTGSAKVKNPFKGVKKILVNKPKKKAKKTNNVQIDAMADQLFALNQPEGLDSEAKPSKLKEVALPDSKKETATQGKTVDGRPITYITTTEKFKASAAFDQQIMLNPGKDVIYPGVVLLGHTIADGTYQEVTKGIKRPITVSFDLTNVKQSGSDKDGLVTGNLVPSLSEFRKLRNKIMGQDVGKVSSLWSFEETKIYSESDFEIKFNMGVGYNTGIVETNVKTGFDFAKGSKKNKYMVKFMQTFYTVDVDQGKDTFLYEKFDIKDFKGYRPVYVSSIAYGRLAYLTIESDETWDKIKADLSVAVDIKTGTKIEGDLSTAVNNLKQNSKINITFIGGENVVTNLDGFLNELANGGFSKNNPGQIIAYKLRFVDDNSVANTVYNDEYTVTRTSERMGQGIDVSFTLYRIKTNANDGSGGSMELYGNLEVGDRVSNKSLWSYSKSSPHKVSEKADNIPVNTTHTFRIPNESADFNFYLNLLEKDSGKDDKFTDAGESAAEQNLPKNIIISNVEDGKDIVIKSYATGKKKSIIRSEWVEYYIRVNKKYIY